MSNTIWTAAFLTAFLVGAIPATAEQWTYPQTDEEVQADFEALHWDVEAGRYELTTSSSTVSLQQGDYLLRGIDAQRYEFLVNGVEFPETEAVITNADDSERVVFEYIEAGYVTDDDWSDLDADALLEEIQAGTEEGNKQRQANGITSLTVIGWLKRPRFDAERKIAFWALKVKEGEDELINAIAIRLSRHGYHKVIWVGDAERYEGTPRILQAALNGHAYEAGYRYADYVDGDALAGFGVASLVAASAGGSKVGKGVLAAILAAVVLFAKKAWFLVFVAIGGVWMGVKRLFARTGERRPPS
ncbi:DUF2167 domain-containing protein [Rhodospirillaceae bacterium SYSU D60014]|uniref:DUF2167 domain-containing protein n=1 Tax=Virgifigura deserti TaxID=2268457 RepID=UPI000E6653F6